MLWLRPSFIFNYIIELIFLVASSPRMHLQCGAYEWLLLVFFSFKNETCAALVERNTNPDREKKWWEWLSGWNFESVYRKFWRENDFFFAVVINRPHVYQLRGSSHVQVPMMWPKNECGQNCNSKFNSTWYSIRTID